MVSRITDLEQSYGIQQGYPRFRVIRTTTVWNWRWIKIWARSKANYMTYEKVNKSNWKKNFYIGKDRKFWIKLIAWEFVESSENKTVIVSFSKIKSQASIQNISKTDWRLYS